MSFNDKIFIVYSNSGYAENNHDRMICAYHDRKLAEQHAEEANKRAIEGRFHCAQASSATFISIGEDMPFSEFMGDLDPTCHIDYETGIMYEVMELEVFDTVPTYSLT